MEVRVKQCGLTLVSHNVWGVRYIATTVPTVETTTELTFTQNNDFDYDNPNDTNFLGATTEESVTEEQTVPSTTEEVLTSTTTVVATTTEILTTTTTPATTSTSSTIPPTIEEINETPAPPTAKPSAATLSLMDLVIDPVTITQNPLITTSPEPSLGGGAEQGAASRPCDCSSGCANDQNCQSSPCCGCGKINFNSVNNGGNFTFNADFRKGCNESNTGCN